MITKRVIYSDYIFNVCLQRCSNNIVNCLDTLRVFKLDEYAYRRQTLFFIEQFKQGQKQCLLFSRLYYII